jgi:hypothetical protein
MDDTLNNPVSGTGQLPVMVGAPAYAFSTSESLASGLVSRLVREWAENDERYWKLKRAATDTRGISKLPTKRALCYRVLRERSLALIPPGHQLIVDSHGDQKGLDKRAGFAIVHWNVAPPVRRLEVLVTYGRPGWPLPLRWSLFVVTDHALQRLFYRLKSLGDGPVLEELGAATRMVCAWFPVLIAGLDESTSVGIPTPHGMLVLKRTSTTAPFSPCEYVATTWVSNALTQSRPGQDAALTTARMTNGLVLQMANQYAPLCPNRVRDRLASMDQPFTNVFYAEMLRHLPLATQMTTLVYGASPD